MSSDFEFTYTFDGLGYGGYFPETWDQIRAKFGNPAKILEIGCFEGFSTCKMIEIFAAHNPITVTCIDTWAGELFLDQRTQPENEARFHKNVALATQRAPHDVQIRTMKSDSFLALSTLIHQGESGTFDWIYLDGSHRATDVLADAVAAFRLLKSGGILVFDDYLWVEGMKEGNNINNTPKPAIDAIVNVNYDRLDVIRNAPSYQFHIRKR